MEEVKAIKDENGETLLIGDTIRGKSIDGVLLEWKIEYSDYRKCLIATNPGEVYDVSESIFNQYEKIDYTLKTKSLSCIS